MCVYLGAAERPFLCVSSRRRPCTKCVSQPPVCDPRTRCVLGVANRTQNGVPGVPRPPSWTDCFPFSSLTPGCRAKRPGTVERFGSLLRVASWQRDLARALCRCPRHRRRAVRCSVSSSDLCALSGRRSLCILACVPPAPRSALVASCATSFRARTLCLLAASRCRLQPFVLRQEIGSRLAHRIARAVHPHAHLLGPHRCGSFHPRSPSRTPPQSRSRRVLLCVRSASPGWCEGDHQDGLEHLSVARDRKRRRPQHRLTCRVVERCVPAPLRNVRGQRPAILPLVYPKDAPQPLRPLRRTAPPCVTERSAGLGCYPLSIHVLRELPEIVWVHSCGLHHPPPAHCG